MEIPVWLFYGLASWEVPGGSETPISQPFRLHFFLVLYCVLETLDFILLCSWALGTGFQQHCRECSKREWVHIHCNDQICWAKAEWGSVNYTHNSRCLQIIAVSRSQWQEHKTADHITVTEEPRGKNVCVHIFASFLHSSGIKTWISPYHSGIIQGWSLHLNFRQPHAHQPIWFEQWLIENLFIADSSLRQLMVKVDYHAILEIQRIHYISEAII